LVVAVVVVVALLAVLGGGLAWYLTRDTARSNLTKAVETAKSAMASEDYRKAKRVLERAIDDFPDRTDHKELLAEPLKLLEEATTKLAQKRAQDAQAQQKQGHDQSARIALSNIKSLVAQRDLELARRMTVRAMEEYAGTSVANDLADLLKTIDREIALARQAMARTDAQRQAAHELHLRYRNDGIAAFDRKDYKAAIDAFQKALREETDSDTQRLLEDAMAKVTNPGLAVVEFQVAGDVGVPDLGRSISEQLLAKFSPDRFQLVERMQLGSLLYEQDLAIAGIVDNPKLAKGLKLKAVRYLVIGTVSKKANLEISARRVDVLTGDIVQTAETCADDVLGLQGTLEELAKILEMSREEKVAYLHRKQEELLAQASRAKTDREFDDVRLAYRQVILIYEVQRIPVPQDLQLNLTEIERQIHDKRSGGAGPAGGPAESVLTAPAVYGEPPGSVDQITIRPGDTTIRAGDYLEINAEVPNSSVTSAEVYIAGADGKETHSRMIQLPAQEVGRRAFTHVFQKGVQSFHYRVRAGDAMSRSYSVNVVPQPDGNAVSRADQALVEKELMISGVFVAVLEELGDSKTDSAALADELTDPNRLTADGLLSLSCAARADRIAKHLATAEMALRQLLMRLKEREGEAPDSGNATVAADRIARARNLAVQIPLVNQALVRGRIANDTDSQISTCIYLVTAMLQSVFQTTHSLISNGDEAASPGSTLRIQVALDWPAYTGRGRQVVQGGKIAALAGTKVAVEAELSVPFLNAWLSFNKRPEIDLAVDGRLMKAGFTVERDDRYQLHYRDMDRKGHVASIAYEIKALLDQPPTVKIAAPSVHSRLGRSDRLRLAGEAADDFGLSTIDLVCQPEGGAEVRVSLAKITGQTVTSRVIDATIPVDRLGSAGQKLVCRVEAQDFAPQAGEVVGQVGRSDPFEISIDASTSAGEANREVPLPLPTASQPSEANQVSDMVRRLLDTGNRLPSGDMKNQAYAQARTLMEDYIRSHPNDTQIRHLLAKLLMDTGQPLEAKKIMNDLGARRATMPVEDPNKELTLDLGNKITMRMALIPAGKFLMGSPDGEKDRFADDEGPQHEVTISKPFYMGVYVVTQAQWKAILGTTLAQQRDKANKDWTLYGEGNDYPMYYVSWDEAVEFCRRLSQKVGKSVRLPTEAQWEYACRAGSKTRFSFGDDDDYGDLGDYAWFRTNSGGKTHAAGQKKPNDFGLYDMHGNVWQWCSDWYAKSYGNGDMTDPQGPNSGSGRVLRGGSFGDPPLRGRSAGRNWYAPGSWNNGIGFRVSVESQ
jgi:formylglycine-generating enzyme required for sulfatase activity/tetratricopeptide (TPR) repeat protein